jgi:O-antigen/teichoic acid export membrane protein
MIENIFLQANKIVPVKWRWVLKHEGFKRYFKNTGWMFFGQIFGLLVSFFVGAWLARYLGPDNYGKVNYVIAFVSMFGFVAHLGVHSILARDLVKYPEKRNELMGTSFFILMAGSVLAFLLVVVSSFVFESSSFIRSLIIIYSSLFLWSPFGVIGVFFSRMLRPEKMLELQPSLFYWLLF